MDKVDYSANTLDRSYHTIFLTNLPAFYKINLFNAIAAERRVLAVFTGEPEDNRNADFFKGQMRFDTRWLRGGALAQCRQLVALLRRTRYERLVISGWDRPQMILAAWCHRHGRTVASWRAASTSPALTGRRHG